MPNPYDLILNAGSHQASKHREDTHDTLRLLEIMAERIPLVASITGLDANFEEGYVADVYVSTTGLSIAGGTKIFSGISIYNCDPNVTYAVNDVVNVNVLSSGIGLIVIQSAGDTDRGQYQGQSKMMVSQNQVSWSYIFANELI